MVVYEICDPTIRTCKSTKEINEALKFSYIFLVKNTMKYQHQEQVGSDQSIQKRATFQWYAVSTDIRQDFPEMITISEIEWDYWRIGFGIEGTDSKRIETIFESRTQPFRFLPYMNTIQLAITFEIEPSQHVIKRQDFTIFEWISNIGGLTFIFNIGIVISSLVENPFNFVAASLFA